MAKTPSPPTAGQPQPQRSTSSVADGLERAANSADRVSASIERAGNATNSWGNALRTAIGIFDDIKKLGVVSFVSVMSAIGTTAFSVVYLSRLLSDMTGIPLSIVSTALVAVGAAAVYAYVPTSLLVGTLGLLATAATTVVTAAITGFTALMAVVVPAGAAIWTALAPILIPVAAIAAAVTAVWAVWSKWSAIPTWVKVIFPPLIVLKITIESIALAFRLLWGAAKLALSVVLLPFTLIIGAAKLAYNTVMLIPRAIMAIPAAAKAVANAAVSSFNWLASAGWSALKTLGSGAMSLASTAARIGARIVSGASSVVSSVVQAPGRMLAYTSGALLAFSGLLSTAGAKATDFGVRIVRPMTEAADAFAAQGTALAKLQADYTLTADQASVFAVAARLTGRSVKELQEIMPAGSAAFAAFRREAAAAGMIRTDQEIQDAKDLTLAYARLKESKAGFWSIVGSVVAPAIKESTDLMLGAVRGATAWIREHKDLIAVAWKIGSTAVTVGAVLATLATTIGTLGTFLTPIAGTAAAVAAGFALWDTASGRAARNLAGGIWDRYGQSVVNAWNTVADYGGRIWRFTESLVEGVTNAVRGGKLDLAVEILWAGAKLAWVNSLSWISSLTSGTFGAIIASLAAGDWSAAGESAMSGLRVAWLTGLQWLVGGWVSVRNAAGEAWTWMASKGDEAFTWLVNKADSAFVSLQNLLDPIWLKVSAATVEIASKAADMATSIIDTVKTVAGVLKSLIGGLISALLTPMLAIPKMAYAAGKAIAQAVAASKDLDGIGSIVAEAGMKGTIAVAKSLAPDVEDPLAKSRRLARDEALRQRTTGRANDLATRQGGRAVGLVVDETRRAQEYELFRANSQREIAGLERRIQQLQSQGDATAQTKAAALQQQLTAAKQEAAKAAEEAKLRGLDAAGATNTTELSDAATQAEARRQNIRTLGTTSSAAAMAMFGGGGSSEPIQQQQLAEQRRITREVKRSAIAAEKLEEEMRRGLAFK